LTKGSIADTLADRRIRLLYALMIRESFIALNAAAKGGKWKPDMTLISDTLPYKLYEWMLILPNLLFYPLAWWFNLFPPPKIISPCQLDLSEGRHTQAVHCLTEMVEVSDMILYVYIIIIALIHVLSCVGGSQI
jgi:hypothetical protein